MSNGKLNTFGKLGRTITKRKFAVIGIWIIILAIVLPVVLTATGINSMTMNSSTQSNDESSKATNIITAQFQKSVSNDSMVIVVSTNNASSLATQQFIDALTNKIKASSTLTGLQNITSVYSILIPALNQTNQGVYLAYNGGNLTYTLLYSVPTIYSNVWYAAYNQTQSQLASGINQTNQAGIAVCDNANMTYSFLYGLPTAYMTVWSTAYNQTHDQLVAGLYATVQNGNDTLNLVYGTETAYLNAWSQAYGQTGDAAASNATAYQYTANYLQGLDPVAYTQYTKAFLDLFSGEWMQSVVTTPLSGPSDIAARSMLVSAQTNTDYINLALAGNQTAQQFVTGLTSAITLADYQSSLQSQQGKDTFNDKLFNYAASAVASSSSSQSSSGTTSLPNPGITPISSTLNSLADKIILNSTAYGMPTNITSTLNEVAYNQTLAYVGPAVPAAYAPYVTQMLGGFNATWAGTLQSTATQTLSPTDRASLVANQTIQNYINTALASNATMQGFVSALTKTFSLNTYLSNTQEQNNAQLLSFSIQYIANQSGSSTSFVNAAYNQGNPFTNQSLTDLANDVIWNSQKYNQTSLTSTFNQVAYNQTETILKGADESSFNDYTSHLLDLFSSSWSAKVPIQSASLVSWLNQTASSASAAANAEFIDAYLSDSKDFSNQIAQAFTLQDFMNANTTYTNSVIRNLTVNYVANESGLSNALVTAIYNMGENATKSDLQTLASCIVSDPNSYNVGEEFNTLIDSFVSPSKDTTLISLTFDASNETNVAALRNLISDQMVQNPTDIKAAQVTGTDAINYDFGQSTTKDLDVILPITIVLLIVATGLFFRSVVTPLITLGTIGVALGVSQIFPYLVGTYINQVDYTVTTVLMTVLIGVGTDYSIFILARHREERINGLPLFEAIKKSITWAGESIVTSGATVIISFFALATTSMVMLQTMGLVVGLGVLVTLLASLTFAPALAAILGDRIFWPNSGERFQRYAKGILDKNNRRGGYFAKSGSFSVKHGKAIILLAVLVTLPAFYVYATTTPTFNMIGAASNNLESIAASNVMTDTFGGGRLMPTYVVVTFSQPLVDSNGTFNMGEMATLNSISNTIAARDGSQEVTGPTMPFGQQIDYQTVTNASDPTTYSTMLSAVGNDNQSALITVKFTVDPYSTQAMDYAKSIRSDLHTNYDSAQNVTGIYLGGTTGSTLDTRVSFENQFNSILPIVALGVGIVLFFVLGSLILPAFAILSVLMSIVWTLAVTVLLFQSAFNFGLLFITPLILFVLLLGLGMDYNIFILTRIREEAAKGQSKNDAIVHAIQQTGGIITAAAIILAGSLGALMLSSNMMLREMGFAFAFSILIDAIVVRTYLVPAVMSTFGKWNWYNPIKRLRRIKDEDLKQNEEAAKAKPKTAQSKQKDQ